jgi:anti-anti-sigma factor
MVRNVEPTGAAVQILLPQQITVKTLPLLERQVDDAIAQRATAVEMLAGGVQIMDSAGLNWLLTARARLEVGGCTLKIVDPSSITMDVFVATRLDSRFVIQVNANGGGR